MRIAGLLVLLKRNHAIQIMKYIIYRSTVKMITYTVSPYIVYPATITIDLIISNYFSVS